MVEGGKINGKIKGISKILIYLFYVYLEDFF